MVARDRYVPERGDIVWVDFSPQEGHEQANRRPAVVLSPKFYNAKSSLALVCPITSHVKGYPFEAPLEIQKVAGAVRTDQVRSIDWRARHVKLIQRILPETLREIQKRILQLLLE